MFTQAELCRTLFIDIETAHAVQKFDDLSVEMQASWIYEAAKLQREGEELLSAGELFERKAGLYPEFGRIVCISIGCLDWIENDPLPIMYVRSFYGSDEGEILLQLSKTLSKKLKTNGKETQALKFTNLCAHNGKEFDFPYICKRFILNQVPLPSQLQIRNKPQWELKHLIDTMEIWKFNVWKSCTRLELLCNAFGIPSPKEEMNGSQVSRVFWEERDVEKISRYCQHDVIALTQLVLKMAYMPVVSSERIVTIEKSWPVVVVQE